MIQKLFFYNIIILCLALVPFIKDNSYFFTLGTLAAFTTTITFFPYRTTKILMKIAVGISFIITILIITSLFTEANKFFEQVHWYDFLFGTKWKPYNTIADNGEIVMMFGIAPLLFGTFLVTLIAILFGGPMGLFSAIYLSKYATKKERNIIKPIIQLLAGIPTVVYGYFAISVVSPFFYKLGALLGVTHSLENSLAAGLVVGIMIIPLITALVDDIIQSVPKSLYYGALALGSTRAEALFKVIIPVALPGILSAILLAITRALGETMVVLMATGVRADLTLNPFHSVTTMTVQIATILKSEHDFNSPVTLSAYAIGFTLFIVTWILNAIAFTIVKKYR